MFIDRQWILYKYLLISFYLSIAIPFIEGILLRHFGLTAKITFMVLSQGFVYIVPIFLIFLTNLNIKRFYLIKFLYLYILITIPFSEFFNISDFFFGVKNHLIIFLYIPILYFLMKCYPCFEQKIEKHFQFLFFLTAVILFFEVISVSLYINPFYTYLRSLATENYPLIGKPNGIDLNIHTQGLILAFATIYYFINQKYFYFVVMLVALFFATVKIYIGGFIVALSLYLVKNILKWKIFLIFLLGVSILSFVLLLNEPLINHYLSGFSFDSESMNIMVNQWFYSYDLWINSLLPNGFISDLNMPNLPWYIHGNEVYIYALTFQIGAIGGILFLLSCFSGIFVKQNKYRILVVLALFSVIHTCPLSRPYVFILVMYFGSYYIIQQKTQNSSLLCTESKIK